MAFAPYITRAVGGNLNLNDGAAYRMDKPAEGDAGGVVMVRRVSTSPHMHGEALIGATRGMKSISARVLVGGVSAAVRNANVATLLAAFTQYTYELHYVNDGIDYGWKCEMADYSCDLRWVFYPDLGGFYCPATFIVPTQPIPVAGPY
jgi:hypothetical protein